MSANGETLVGLGQVACVRGAGTLMALGLGSCVAVLLHDPERRVGGLAHVLLPSRTLSIDRNPGKFAETAVPLLMENMTRQGGERSGIVGRLVGGASMFAQLTPKGTIHMGERNIVACRSALRELGIPVVAEAVGGGAGRSVWFNVADGTVSVRLVGREPIFL